MGKKIAKVKLYFRFALLGEHVHSGRIHCMIIFVLNYFDIESALP